MLTLLFPVGLIGPSNPDDGSDPSLTAATRGARPEEVTYMTDTHVAHRCNGDSRDLHYVVFTPSTPGPHPVVFGMVGSAFNGGADCVPGAGEEGYRLLDPVMQGWAHAGYVAVNIEYHGISNGLFGDATYPGAGRWGGVADGTTELNVKPAVRYFMSHQPGQYGADTSSGVYLFGASSGGHNAYMLADTGLPGVRIAAAIGWSGLPEAAASGPTIRGIYDRYMRAQPNTDLEHFGDPFHRLAAGAPPQYVANGTDEVESPADGSAYADRCTELHLPACWLRIAHTNLHADAYAPYRFTGISPELSRPVAQVGVNVLADAALFSGGPSNLVAVTGDDGSLLTKSDSGDYRSLGGSLVAAPAVVAAPREGGGTTPLFIGVGADRDLFVRSPTRDWQRLAPQPVSCEGSPAATVATDGGGAVLTVACEGGDQALYYGQVHVTGDAPPRLTTPLRSLGGQLSGGPAVTVVNGELTFFVTGDGGQLFSRTLTTDFVPLPAACIGHPAAASLGATTYLACHGVDDALHYAVNTGSGWGAFRSAGGSMIDGPGIALSSNGAVIYLEGGDQQLYHTVVDLTTNQPSEFARDGGSIHHGVGAVAQQRLQR